MGISHSLGSFRDAPLGADPESRDSGFALRAPRNDGDGCGVPTILTLSHKREGNGDAVFTSLREAPR